jgi:hypothetical protein
LNTKNDLFIGYNEEVFYQLMPQIYNVVPVNKFADIITILYRAVKHIVPMYAFIVSLILFGN